MNIFGIMMIGILISHISAEFKIISLIPNGTISTNTHEFKIEIDKEVNSPKSSSYIRIHNSTTKIWEIAASSNDTNIVYDKKAVIFHLPDSYIWNINIEYYITLDKGVLYSDNTSESLAQTDPKFWTFIYVPTNESSTTPSTSNSSSGTNAIKPSTAFLTLPTGEPSPTRSAQLGMGLCITLIGILIIIEIIYFKHFYRSPVRSGNYLA